MVKNLPETARCQDTSSKANLWMNAQHEGVLTSPCIVRKNTTCDEAVNILVGMYFDQLIVNPIK